MSKITIFKQQIINARVRLHEEMCHAVEWNSMENSCQTPTESFLFHCGSLQLFAEPLFVALQTQNNSFFLFYTTHSSAQLIMIMDEIVHTHEFLIGFRLLLENQQEKESPAWANDDDDVGKQSLEEKSYLMKESAKVYERF